MSTGVTAEIKSKLDIVHVISDYIQVKKAGTRFVALCPFHNEKSPSFSISPENQFYYCFGCGEGGDVFGFVQRMEGMDFPEALRLLAKKAGVELRQEDPREYREKQVLYDINRFAAKFYHEVLLRSSQAEAAREYVKTRGLTADTLEDFSIGFAPDSWDATINFLRKKKFKDSDIARAGLTVKNDRGGYFDRFRGRLMFPIADMSGAIVGFTGRILPGKPGVESKEAKYVNSPQTPIYDKSHILFAFDKAKQEIRKKGFVVIVEGNMDAVASHQAGIKNVVASSGTAFTAEHVRRLETLKRLAGKVVLSFDNDPAGEKAARRSIDALVAAGFSVRVLRIPPGAGKDPDDCIRKDPQLWHKAVVDAVPYMEWYLQLAKERTNFADPDSVREASALLRDEVAKIVDAVERNFWVRTVAELFKVRESVIFDDVEKRRKPIQLAKPQPVATAAPKKPAKISRDALISRNVVALALGWPEFAAECLAAVPVEAVDESIRPLYRSLHLFYTDPGHRETSASVFRAYCEAQGDPDMAKAAMILALEAQRDFGDLSPAERKATFATVLSEIKKLYVTRRQRELVAAMAQAEQIQDATAIAKIQEQLHSLLG